MYIILVNSVTLTLFTYILSLFLYILTLFLYINVTLISIYYNNIDSQGNIVKKEDETWNDGSDIEIKGWDTTTITTKNNEIKSKSTSNTMKKFKMRLPNINILVDSDDECNISGKMRRHNDTFNSEINDKNNINNKSTQLSEKCNKLLKDLIKKDTSNSNDSGGITAALNEGVNELKINTDDIPTCMLYMYYISEYLILILNIHIKI